MTRRLEGKVAIITGASQGLGQYCSVAYGREGAVVAVAARTEQESDPRMPGTIYETARLVDEAGGEGSLSSATWQIPTASPGWSRR